MKYVTTVDGTDFAVEIEHAGEVTLEGQPYAIDLRPIDNQYLYSLIIGHQSYDLFVERRSGQYLVLIEGDRYLVDVEDAHLKQLKAMGGQRHEEHGTVTVSAPMPGLVVKLLVAVGDRVEAGDGLVILEAMKMENELRSPRPGVIKSIQARAAQTVNLGDVLLVVGDEE